MSIPDVKYRVGARPNSSLLNMTKTPTIKTVRFRYLFDTQVKKEQILKEKGPNIQKLALAIFYIGYV